MIFGEDFHCVLNILEKCSHVKILANHALNYKYFQNHDSVSYHCGKFHSELISLIKLKKRIEDFCYQKGLNEQFEIFNSTLYNGRRRVIESIYSTNNQYTKKQRIKYLKELWTDKYSKNIFFQNRNRKTTKIVYYMALIGLWYMVDKLAKKGLLT